MFELITFDLDGTLTDSKEGITNCIKYALESFGIVDFDQNLLLKSIGPPLYDAFHNIFGFPHDDALLAVKKYRERFSDVGIYENTVFPDAEETLKRFKNAGIRLAVATSKPHIYTERILKHFGLYDYFDYIVGAEFDGSFGSKEDVIGEVLRLAESCDLTKTAMVGNRKFDILGAKKFKITAVGINSGYAAEGELEASGADFIFNNLKEFADFILSNNSPKNS